MGGAKECVNVLHGEGLSVFNVKFGCDIRVNVQPDNVAEVPEIGNRVNFSVNGCSLHFVCGPNRFKFLGSVCVVIGQVGHLPVFDVSGKRRHKRGNDIGLIAGEQKI